MRSRQRQSLVQLIALELPLGQSVLMLCRSVLLMISLSFSPLFLACGFSGRGHVWSFGVLEFWSSAKAYGRGFYVCFSFDFWVVPSVPTK